MAGSLNKCQFIGNLGADPEVKTTQGGNKVANLSLACSETWKDKNTGERRERTEWIRIVIWNEGLVRVAEQYLKKGAKIYISGKMQTRKWQDQSGADRYSTEVVLQGFGDELLMLDGRRDGDQDNGSQSSGRPDRDRGQQSSGGERKPAFESGSMDDDIPF